MSVNLLRRAIPAPGRCAYVTAYRRGNEAQDIKRTTNPTLIQNSFPRPRNRKRPYATMFVRGWGTLIGDAAQGEGRCTQAREVDDPTRTTVWMRRAGVGMYSVPQRCRNTNRRRGEG